MAKRLYIITALNIDPFDSDYLGFFSQFNLKSRAGTSALALKFTEIILLRVLAEFLQLHTTVRIVNWVREPLA